MKVFQYFNKSKKDVLVPVITVSLIVSLVVGTVAGSLAFYYLNNFIKVPALIKKSSSSIKKQNNQTQHPVVISQEEAVIKAVKSASPAVVSIIITKDLPVIEKYYQEYDPFKNFFGGQDFGDFFAPFKFKIPRYRQKGTEQKEVGGGTGFIISNKGLVLTNKHVVSDKDASYTVLTNEGKKYKAEVLAIDPVQDLALLKIKSKKSDWPFLKLGDSDNLEIGQTVIAIGNALGEFRNTVSVGVISGLKRSVKASGGFGQSEYLEEVIQTDAAVNQGNSGGPLLNLKGEVIGINVAMAVGAENIGFSIPINKAKRDIEQVEKSGKITYPFLGVRYIQITPTLAEKNNLSVNYGALIIRGENSGDLAVIPGSPADKAGLVENDIILELNGTKITSENNLSKLIQKYKPGEQVELKILHKGKEKIVKIVLGERS